MTSPLLDEKVLALEAALAKAGIAHAFGGAIALAYYATPRGTVDIDLNVFVGTDQAARVFDAIGPLGVDTAGAAESSDLRDGGQIRLRWEHTPLDLFFAYDPLHESCMERIASVPFGAGAAIPILSAEDLAIFKAIFDRPKDWRDIRELLFALGEGFDVDYTRGWLQRILESDDSRLARLEDLLRAPR